MKTLELERVGKRYRLGKPTGQQLVPPFLSRLWSSGEAPTKRREQRDLWALKDVSFAASAGEVLGVIGPNGAGKTTMLKVIGRVTPPTEGRVRGRGRVVSLLELGAGFQADLTARENLFLNAAIYGIPAVEVERRLDDIVAFAEIGDFVDTPVKRYSSGMYLRFAFSVAINLEPDILLADEILAVGDLSFRERCLERVEQAGREGMTVLFVSHDMALIRQVSRRVLWLNGGRVVADGPAEEVVAAYERAVILALDGADGSGDGGTRNRFGAIQSVRLESAAGEEIGAVRVSDDVFLKVAFTAFEPGTSVRCVFDVYARDVMAFRTPQPFPVPVERGGAFEARVRVPAHLLSETDYSVSMWVVFYEDGRPNPLLKKNAISFRVFDNRPLESARGDYVNRLPGAVTPKLEWAVTAGAGAAAGGGASAAELDAASSSG